MRKQTILSIAIMVALPFGAHATDPVGPAAVPANGTAVVATANAPYVTQTPTAADATHIASTAYVKGAYNDAIAAVNKVANTVDGKQAQLINNGNNHTMYNKVLSGSFASGLGSILIDGNNNEYAAMSEDIARQLTNMASGNPDETLISTGAVFNIVREAGQAIKDDMSSELSGTQSTLQTAISDKQDKLVNYGNNHTMYNKVLGGDVDTIGQVLVEGDDDEYIAVYGNMAYDLTDGASSNPDEILISTGAVFNIVREAGQTLQDNIDTVQSSMNTALNNKRVEIYTTWENDNAKQQVAFVNAQ